MTLAITANAEESAIKIRAAVDRLPASIKRLAASANIELTGTLITGKLDAALAKTGMPALKRLELKIGLNKAGLLVD